MRPEIAAPPAWNFPAGTARVLENGLRVWLYQLPGQYVVTASLVIEAPLTREPADREGVGTICLRTLDEGTQAHPGEAFAEQLENRGAVFSGNCGLSATECTLDVPVGEFGAGLRLFAEAVRTPQFAAADVERQVALRLAEIDSVKANSASLANVTLRATVLDPASRAARMNGGEATTVSTVTVADLHEFHAANYRPEVATLLIAGDLRGVDVWSEVTAAFGDWRPAGGGSEHVPPRPGAARERLVHRPGSVQADVRLGSFAVGRDDPLWPALQVACYAMGGAFLSRLNKVLREERGYTYGISATPHPLRGGGFVSVHGSFRTEVVPAALAETRELLDVSNRPFTGAEVTDAIAYLTGVAPLRYATAAGVAGQVAAVVAAGLGPDYVDRNLAAIRAVTPESATAAYLELVAPAATSIVVVGDADALSGPLGLQREEID